MLRQIKYFQAVVRNNSFSEAAEECHISQSAISQQIKALEHELGVLLLERRNRKFILTPAGEHFYKKSLILTADYEQLCRETERIAHGENAALRIGYLRSYGGRELQPALEKFSAAFPRAAVQLLYGNHEELFQLLRNGEADLVLNDQRRAFSDEYVNLVLTSIPACVELSSRNPLAALPALTPQALKNIPCILVSSRTQQEAEREYYQTVIGLQGEFLYAGSLEEAHLLVAGGQGFLPVEGPVLGTDHSVCHIPLCRGDAPILRTYCLFWKKAHSGRYTEAFADILKKEFQETSTASDRFSSL